jgi:RES domain-containing protein
VAIERRRIRWRPCYRAIPSRFPPVNLFERITDPADLEAVIELESLTNDRLRDAAGEIALVPPAERVVGPGSGYVMAAFTHPSPSGGRFNEANVGAWYAGRRLATAIAETKHHREGFMRATSQPPMELDMRILEAELDARLHDIRGQQQQLAAVYDPDDYTASQALAASLRAQGSDGIVYDSVRDPGGQCVAVFRPKRVRRCRSASHVTFVWDGERVSEIYEKRALPEYPPPSPRQEATADFTDA